jgi:hypothetical protein
MSDVLACASPIASDLYAKLKAALAPFGVYSEEIKKTSIHLVRHSAFLGVHPRKEHLLVTIKSDKAMKSRPIVKTEQVSANRWHLEVKVYAPSEIDKEFLAWAQRAYDLCGERRSTSPDRARLYAKRDCQEDGDQPDYGRNV